MMNDEKRVDVKALLNISPRMLAKRTQDVANAKARQIEVLDERIAHLAERHRAGEECTTTPSEHQAHALEQIRKAKQERDILVESVLDSITQMHLLRKAFNISSEPER